MYLFPEVSWPQFCPLLGKVKKNLCAAKVSSDLAAAVCRENALAQTDLEFLPITVNDRLCTQRRQAGLTQVRVLAAGRYFHAQALNISDQTWSSSMRSPADQAILSNDYADKSQKQFVLIQTRLQNMLSTVTSRSDHKVFTNESNQRTLTVGGGEGSLYSSSRSYNFFWRKSRFPQNKEIA